MKSLIFVNLFVILVVAVVCEEEEEALFPENTNTHCENMPCPINTTGCKKHIKTSADKRSLEKRISCLDENNDVLKEYFLQDANPYGPYVFYETTSYSNTHSMVITNPSSHNVISYGTNTGNRYDGNIVGSDKTYDGLERFE